ncbi:unnamed protein product, partial [Discosporangium mesarthrocarpum]
MTVRRLLILRHGQMCGQGRRCPLGSECAEMRELWDHISTCTEINCERSQCVDASTEVQHLALCGESKCSLCGPVVEKIRKAL